MQTRAKEIIITLENENEAQDLWNIIMFAFDWNGYAKENNKSTMNDREEKMANELVDLLEKGWK